MAHKKNYSPGSMVVIIGVFVAVVLAGSAYLVGVSQRVQESDVLAATTATGSTPTKAGSVASAAYSKCVQNGGFVTTARRGTYGYYSVCNFADDMNCELYSLYNGQCPVGGVHTIGYSTSGQVFCALRGGTPTGSENGKCKMPDGVTCSTDAVYRGTCAAN